MSLSADLVSVFYRYSITGQLIVLLTNQNS